jgi:hypothetical protein
VHEIAADKAPGPDGFIGVFQKQNREVIKSDLLSDVDYFFRMHDQHLSQLCTAHIVLIPKVADAKRVGDFRPISLTHSVAKLISKLLANILAPELDGLVSRAQSAFIKRCSIQDNFIYAQNTIRAFHRGKQPGLFLKLDIAKAFDSVRWDFLLEVLAWMGLLLTGILINYNSTEWI